MMTLREIANRLDSLSPSGGHFIGLPKELSMLAAEIRKHAPKFQPPLVICTQESQERAYQHGTRVFLYHNDDCGTGWQWSVALCESPDFWIWSYKTKRAATDACKRNGWTICGAP